MRLWTSDTLKVYSFTFSESYQGKDEREYFKILAYFLKKTREKLQKVFLLEIIFLQIVHRFFYIKKVVW